MVIPRYASNDEHSVLGAEQVCIAVGGAHLRLFESENRNTTGKQSTASHSSTVLTVPHLIFEPGITLGGASLGEICFPRLMYADIRCLT